MTLLAIGSWFQGHAAETMWAVWIVIWLATAGSGKRTVESEPVGSRLLTSAVLIAGGALIVAGGSVLRTPGAAILSDPHIASAIGLPLTALGLAFALWARVRLGRNWSGVVSIKQDHELITSGPYALVRHPIYAGIACALAGTALAFNQWRDAFGFFVVLAGVLRKARLEEQILTSRFGDAYREYAARVPSLLPGVRWTTYRK